MINPDFQLKLLLKQNSEMISKMQTYRRENQQLIQKNHDLNLWVQNFAEVFAGIGAAWKTITNNEEALFNLMKKRGDANSKALISKYVSHFRTFDEIINNLGEKITNSGHSNDAALEAKDRLNAFVQNYELFFKEIVDSYFKFNDEYLQWITQLKNKTDISQNFRTVANKEIENKMKIKEFESFIGEFRGRFKIYEFENQHKLLDGILFSKNQQINSINQLSQKQSRRINLMLNYISPNAQAIISGDANEFDCFCGGRQVQYFKKQWENHLEQLRNQQNQAKVVKNGDVETLCQVNRQDLEHFQIEKQHLLDKIVHLQSKIQNNKIQSRLTEQLVVNSSAYDILKNQAQQLIDYVNELLHKISNHYNYLYDIEKARQQEILELKQKLQKSEINSLCKIPSQSPKPLAQSSLLQFKTSISEQIKWLTSQFHQINSKTMSSTKVLNESKQYISLIQKQNEQLHKKLQSIDINKSIVLQFRHQKFSQLQKKINQLLTQNKHDQTKSHLNALWKEFIDYVKSRDKKVRDLQNVIKKRDKQIIQKDKLLSLLKSNLTDTENIYISTQTQLKKFNQFVVHTQKQLHSLSEKNIALKMQYEKEKSQLLQKTRSESEQKVKMQEKLKHYESVQQQINEIKKLTQQAQQNYQKWIKQQQQRVCCSLLQTQQMRLELTNQRNLLQQKQRCIKKLLQQKQKLKSQSYKLQSKLHSIQTKQEMSMAKVQLQEYKRKMLCSCARGYQRSVVLNTCPHMFCRKCIDDMKNNRNRKCPHCLIKFGVSDIHDVVFN